MKKLIICFLFFITIEKSFAAEGDEWNFRFSPIAYLVGIINGDLDYKVSENIVIGPSLVLINLKLDEKTYNVNSFGVQGSYYFESAFKDGFYLGGNFSTISAEVSTLKYGPKITGSQDGTLVGLKCGYHWFWNSFNLNLGLTATSTAAMSNIKLIDNTGKTIDEVSPTKISSRGVDFAIGFTF